MLNTIIVISENYYGIMSWYNENVGLKIMLRALKNIIVLLIDRRWYFIS